MNTIIALPFMPLVMPFMLLVIQSPPPPNTSPPLTAVFQYRQFLPVPSAAVLGGSAVVIIRGSFDYQVPDVTMKGWVIFPPKNSEHHGIKWWV